MDLVSVLFGAFLAFLSGTIGMFVERRRNQAIAQSADTQQPKPICTCKHPLSVHQNGGKCSEEVSRWNDQFKHDEWVPCRCAKYLGPVPINEIWVPPVIAELPEKSDDSSAR